MIVTEALINYGRTKKGGWKKRQFRLLGLGWPQGKGWKPRVIGSEIEPEAALEFVRLGRHCDASPLDIVRLMEPKNDEQEPAPHDEWRAMCAEEYAERASNLKSIGFDSYPQYRDSDLWVDIREQVLDASGGLCGCGAKASQAHHGDYRVATLLGDDLSGLRAVCGYCHRQCEYDNGRKRPPSLTLLALAEVTERNRERREKRLAKRKFVPATMVFESGAEILVLVKTQHQEALADSLGDALVRLEIDGHRL